MNLRWTNAGRAALADAANVGTAALRLTHFAIGDGQGPGGAGDDGRAALRSERHRAGVSGTAAADGRIAFRADFAPDASYGISEAGVFGTAGDPAGPLALYLYWTDGGTLAGQAADGTALAVASVIEFQAAAADVAVTVGGTIEFGDPPEEATEGAFGLTRYATDTETDSNSRVRSVTPGGLRARLGALLARLIGAAATESTVYQLRGDANGNLFVEERTQDAMTSAGITANSAAIVDLQQATRSATTGRSGIVELATRTETETGTDGTRAVTPEGLQDGLSKLVGGLKDVAPTAGEKIILEGVAGGGVKAVRAPFDVLRFELGGSVDPSGTAHWVSINGMNSWTVPRDGTYWLAGAVTLGGAGGSGVSMTIRRTRAGAQSNLVDRESPFEDGTENFSPAAAFWSGDLEEDDEIAVLLKKFSGVFVEDLRLVHKFFAAGAA